MLSNIYAQDISLRLYTGEYTVIISVFVGTMVGLILKYFLDKKFIFQFQVNNTVHEGQTFFLYTVMGIVTTAVFWGFEFAFDYYYNTKTMRYVGGAIGLSIGYYLKYQLDKRFVFVQSSNTA